MYIQCTLYCVHYVYVQTVYTVLCTLGVCTVYIRYITLTKQTIRNMTQTTVSKQIDTDTHHSFVGLTNHLFFYLFTLSFSFSSSHLFIYLFTLLFIYSFFHLSIHLFIHPLFIQWKLINQSIYSSIYLTLIWSTLEIVLYTLFVLSRPTNLNGL